VRLFVALEIPSAVRDNLAAMIRDLRLLAPQLKLVRAENLHVTLKFIGETPEEKLGAIRGALSSIQSKRSVHLCFRGLGFFPNEKRPSVLWAGTEASANLVALAGDVDRVLEAVGIPRERRAFTPHLTLARLKDSGLPEKLRTKIRQNATRDFGAFNTHEFHLIESKLKPSGAEYTTLQSFSFAAAEA
jgi:RNA 2',3'-cyclic 3'-phosphodiesterase